jgi:hypothetical protein
MELKKYRGRVYIASPYTLGAVEENVRYSIQQANVLLLLGFQPYAPLLNHYWNQQWEHSYEEWLQFDISWMLQCDCVLRLPGESKGADLEVQIAKEHNIPVYFDMTDLLTQECIYKVVDKLMSGC